MNPPVQAAHPADGQLLRLLDEGPDGLATRDADSHLRGCAACRDRLQRLRRRSATWDALLRELDAGAVGVVPPAPEWPRRPASGGGWAGTVTLRRAAAVALVVGAAAALPAAATIGGWITRQWERIGGSPAAVEIPAPTGISVPEPPAAAEIRFVPGAPELDLEFRSRQQAGSLRVEAGQGREATLYRGGAGAGEALLVLPAGLRVENAPDSRADYRLALPADVRVLRVRIGSDVVVVRGDEIAGGAVRRIELRPHDR